MINKQKTLQTTIVILEVAALHLTDAPNRVFELSDWLDSAVHFAGEKYGATRDDFMAAIPYVNMIDKVEGGYVINDFIGDI